MFAVNFEIRAVVFEGDVLGDRGKKRLLRLSFDRDFFSGAEQDDKPSWDEAPLEVIQSQGMFTCVDTTPTAKLKKGDPDHELLHGVINFVNRWCQENNPFNEE